MAGLPPQSEALGQGEGLCTCQEPTTHGPLGPLGHLWWVMQPSSVQTPPLHDAPAQGCTSRECQRASLLEWHSPWVQGHPHSPTPHRMEERERCLPPLGAAQEAPCPLTEPTNLGSSILGLRPPKGPPSSLISPSLSPALEGQRRDIDSQELTGDAQPWGRGEEVGFRGSRAGS